MHCNSNSPLFRCEGYHSPELRNHFIRSQPQVPLREARSWTKPCLPRAKVSLTWPDNHLVGRFIPNLEKKKNLSLSHILWPPRPVFHLAVCYTLWGSRVLGYLIQRCQRSVGQIRGVTLGELEKQPEKLLPAQAEAWLPKALCIP